jgi:hypothetical protein
MVVTLAGGRESTGNTDIKSTEAKPMATIVLIPPSRNPDSLFQYSIVLLLPCGLVQSILVFPPRGFAAGERT